jgi:hypothetical protein
MSLKLPINIDDKLIPISYAELVQAEAAYEAEQTKVAMAEQALHETSARYAAKEEELNKALAEQGALVLRLQEELKKIPPVVLPVTRKPTISRPEMNSVAGICVAKGNAPSASQDQNARDLILLASFMGFNVWRGFMNLQEVKAHTAMLDSNINHLPGYGRRLNVTFVADTVNWAAVNLSDVDLVVYLNGLVKMGAAAFYFDDANQYRDTTKYPAGKLEVLVKRVRDITPQVPLIASLTATATINDYKPLFDHVEAQTFGKITELEGFLKRGFDVYCLDGRKEISVDYLTQATEIILRNPVRSFFFYPTTATEWKSMTLQLPIIKTLVQRGMSMAR